MAPTITSAASAGVINESSDAGQVIYTATATDSADVSDGFTFSLLGADASAFSVSNDENTFGEVTLIDKPSFETKPEYNFEVIATDAAGNISDAQAVSLTVESGVAITSSAIANAIDENSAAGQVIYTATSNKDDVTYTLAQDSDSDLSIEATGEVTLSVSPNFEDKTQYIFTVIATSIESGSYSEK